MIPGPDVKEGYFLREVEDVLLREYIFTHMHDTLSDLEQNCYSFVVKVLQGKMKAGIQEVDISQMAQHLERNGNAVTELLCRRMINKFEWDYIGRKYFIIVNGKKNWEKFDALRTSQIQKRTICSDN